MRLPLEGVRILDLCWVVAGPFASRALADFGADVIKIESRMRPDQSRGNRNVMYGKLPGDANSDAEAGGYFSEVNGGKRSCTLNLATEGGQEILARLVAKSDAVICNLRGGQLARWGLSNERLRELNPGLIVVNMPAFESRGPRQQWKGFGDHFTSASGIKSMTGMPGAEPMWMGHPYPDWGPNPMHTAIVLLAALHQRRRTGEGALIDVSQYESTIAVTGTMLLEYASTGAAPGQQGNHDAEAVPHNMYRCKGDDSWCAIAVYNDEQWTALSAIPGLEALADPTLSSFEERRRREDEIDAIIESWTTHWDRQELAAELQGRGVPAGPMQYIDEFMETDPTLSDRQYIRLPHPVVGREFVIHRSPLEMRRRPNTPRLGPTLGADTFDILTEVAGLSVDEIAEYAAAGALE